MLNIMNKIDEKLWDTYELQFPTEKKLSFVIGENGTGKSHLLRHLKNYYERQGENVIYFSDERVFLHDPQKVKELLTKHSRSLRAIFGMEEKRGKSFVLDHGIKIDLLNLEEQVGRFIYQGKMQLVNFFATILPSEKESIVLIDEPERNLTIFSQKYLINDLLSLKGVKQLIVATHAPCLITDFDQCVEMKNCIIKPTILEKKKR